MKKLLKIFLIICLFVPMILISNTVKAQTIKWKYLSYIPQSTGCGTNSEWILSEIERRTEGKMKFERYWSAVLGKPSEYPKMLKSNIVQMALLGTGYSPDIFKLTRAFDLHMITDDAEAFTASSLKLYDKFAPFREEFTKNGMMFYWPNVGARFTLVSRIPAYKWEDFKGAKVRTYGPQAVLWKKWGANAVNIPFSEAYQALERGTFDVMTGVMFVSHIGMKFHEVVPRIIDVGEGTFGLFPETISLKAWNKLPDDIKKVFMDVQKDALKQRWTVIEPEFEKKNIETFMKTNTTFVLWSAKERMRGYEQGMPDIHKEWIDEMKEKGLPGDEFLSSIKEEIKKYREVNPEWLWVPPSYEMCSKEQGGIWKNGECSPLP